MSTRWRLEVSWEEQGESGAGLCLDLVQNGTEHAVRLLAGRSSLEDFEAGLEALQTALAAGLEGSLEEGRELLAEEGDSGQEDVPADPEAVWSAMEELPEKAFCEYFNGLPAEKRQEVAEYVFTQVNMFKGKGPLFAARFDRDSGRLS